MERTYTSTFPSSPNWNDRNLFVKAQTHKDEQNKRKLQLQNSERQMTKPAWENNSKQAIGKTKALSDDTIKCLWISCQKCLEDMSKSRGEEKGKKNWRTIERIFK